MEPGRFLVARAGVLVGRRDAAQGQGGRALRRHCHGHEFTHSGPPCTVRIHDIRNLTRLDEAVEPSGQRGRPDLRKPRTNFGADRWLPPTAEGDVLLIATCGAYGYSMASSLYNLTCGPPAPEFMLAP